MFDLRPGRRIVPPGSRGLDVLPSSLAVALGFGLLCIPTQALALGPLDLEVGTKVGGGSNPGGTGASNPLGFGFGGRAGVSLRGLFGLYGGVNFVYYRGSNQTDDPGGLPGPCCSGGPVTTSTHSLEYGIELGSGYKLGPVTLRGQVGIGNFEIDQSITPNRPPTVPGGFPGSEHYLYVEPGVVGLVSLGFLYVGVDVNALLLPAGPSYSFNANGTAGHALDGAVTAHGQVGVTF